MRSPAVSISERTFMTSAEAIFEASPSSLESSQCLKAWATTSEGSPCSRYVRIRSAMRSRIWLTPRNMPNPYSALSSKSEFAHAGPLPSELVVYAMEGELALHMDEQPVAFAIIIRSPNSWVISLTYGVSPHPGQAPLYSSNGCMNWLPFSVFLSMTFFLGDRLSENSQLSSCTPVSSSAGTITSAFSDVGHTSAQLPQPVQSRGLTWTRKR